MPIIKINSTRTIQFLIALIALLTTALLVQSSNLADQRKTTISQSNFCLKYTSENIANSSLQLIREQDAHQRDIDRANDKIIDLVERYNKISTKKNPPLNPYSFLILSSS